LISSRDSCMASATCTSTRIKWLNILLPRLDLLQGLLYGLRHLHINKNQMTEYPPVSPWSPPGTPVWPPPPVNINRNHPRSLLNILLPRLDLLQGLRHLHINSNQPGKRKGDYCNWGRVTTLPRERVATVPGERVPTLPGERVPTVLWERVTTILYLEEGWSLMRVLTRGKGDYHTVPGASVILMIRLLYLGKGWLPRERMIPMIEYFTWGKCYHTVRGEDNVIPNDRLLHLG
jgi:hypothetical protein